MHGISNSMCSPLLGRCSVLVQICLYNTFEYALAHGECDNEIKDPFPIDESLILNYYMSSCSSQSRPALGNLVRVVQWMCTAMRPLGLHFLSKQKYREKLATCKFNHVTVC